MKANIKRLLVLATVMAALTGCAMTEDYDLYEIVNVPKNIFLEEVLNKNLNYSRTAEACATELPLEQKVIAKEYGEYSIVVFPEEYQGTDYCYPYKEDAANAYHVTKFQGSAETPIEFEWIGEMEFGREINKITELEKANYIELTNSSDTVRLFAMSRTYKKDKLDSSQGIVWNRYIDADVIVVRDGLCEITEREDGYRVLVEVESDTRKGYASIFVDADTDTVTQFVYTEVLEQYDDERAKTFVNNLQMSDGIITQKNDKICVEAGEKIEFIPGEYLDGNPWELSQCIVDQENKEWCDIGDYSCVISLLNQEYPLQVEVRDTTPPEVALGEVLGFAVEGKTLYWDEGIMCAKDWSYPIKVYYKGTMNDMIVTEELCDKEGYINVTVCVEDSAGNVTQKDAKFFFIPSNDETMWMEKVGVDAELFWERASDAYADSYFEALYNEESSKITPEKIIKQEEEVWGLSKVKEGFDIAESGIIDIRYENEGTNEMKQFYEGLSYVPENVLQEYAERGWQLKVIDEEMDNHITGGNSAGDTWVDYRRIRYTTAARQKEATTIPHEFGHFVDYVLGWKSQSAKFMALYNERKKNRETVKTEKYNEWSTKDSDGIYRGYSFSNEQEFFADSFEKCLTEPEKMQETYPEIYDYIMECIEKL